MSVAVVRLPRRHVPPPPAPALPGPVLDALHAIAEDLRHVPRACFIDHAELLVWLRRLAGRVEAVGRMRVPDARPEPRRAPAAVLRDARPVPPREAAEAVFGKAPGAARRHDEVRTVTSRKGRAVTVQVRRARPAGQLELGL